MIGALVRQADLGHLAKLATPAFFDVLPSRLLWSAGRDIVKRYRDKQGFESAVKQRRTELERRGVAVDLRSDGGEPPVEIIDPQVYAERIVQLYFHQIWFGDAVLLDLGPKALTLTADGLCWYPGPLWTTWDPAFVGPLRDVYTGFYRDRPGQFSAGLDALGLAGSEALFRKQFGEDPSATRFELKRFIDSFNNIFTFCKDQKIALPVSFVPLGLALASMYENIDRFDVVVDVRRAFDIGTQGVDHRS